MTEGRDVPDEAELAARFREIANRTAWSLDDDAEDVLARLRVFHNEVTDLVSFDEILPIVLDSEALFGFYGYAVALGKNIDVSAAGRLPERRGISHADHLDEIRSRMPHVHAELQVGIVLRARKVRKGRLWWISLLKAELDRLGVDPSRYSVEGGRPEDGFAIKREGRRWIGYYSERGGRYQVEKFLTEDAACRWLLDRLTETE